jgi:hypothetical protein
MLKLKDCVFSFFVIAMLTARFVGLISFAAGCSCDFHRSQSPMEQSRRGQRAHSSEPKRECREMAGTERQNELDATGSSIKEMCETGVGNRLTGLAYGTTLTSSRVPQGQFFNFSQAGYRAVKDQGPWPPDPKYFNIFFFGTSLVMGMGPDWASIPSYFQGRLDGHPVNGKVVKVYNFARPYYFSTQERILFQQLLLDGYIPDQPVFADNPNGSCSMTAVRFDRAPSTDIPNHGRRASDMERPWDRSSPWSNRCRWRARRGLADQIFRQGSASSIR